MFNDRWKRTDSSGGTVLAAPPAIQSSGRGGGSSGPPRSRQSNGLDQFFAHIKGEAGLNLLDLSGASQANIGFITSLGHRLYSEDLVDAVAQCFGDSPDQQSDPDRQRMFLEQTLSFPPNHFDGALVWDGLELLAPELLKLAVDRLHTVIKAGSYVFALFRAEARGGPCETYSYRIADARTLLLAPRGTRRPVQFLSNRAVEKVFQQFENVKFFLSRDSLREVIVKR